MQGSVMISFVFAPGSGGLQIAAVLDLHPGNRRGGDPWSTQGRACHYDGKD